jgi:hypothetical protein
LMGKEMIFGLDLCGLSRKVLLAKEGRKPDSRIGYLRQALL